MSSSSSVGPDTPVVFSPLRTSYCPPLSRRPHGRVMAPVRRRHPEEREVSSPLDPLGSLNDCSLYGRISLSLSPSFCLIPVLSLSLRTVGRRSTSSNICNEFHLKLPNLLRLLRDLRVGTLLVVFSSAPSLFSPSVRSSRGPQEHATHRGN